MRRLLSAALVLAMIFMTVGCSDLDEHSYAELVIELPSEYEVFEAKDTYDLALTNGVAVIGINRISRVSAAESGMPDWLSPSEFAAYYLYMSVEKSEIEYVGQVPYYSYYHTPIGADQQFCLAAFYRSQYAYFTVFCFVSSSAEAGYIGDFIDFIDNVRFQSIDD